MAGTDEEAVTTVDEEAVATVDDDALYVLTAVLLTPAKFPSVLGDDYPEACATLGLAPLAEGYGLVLGQDGEGARWTVVIDDVSLVAVAIASWDCGMEHELSPDERTVVAALPGWPLEVAVAAPGIPAPHDPSTDPTERPPLTPPDTTTWGPAQRRLGADEIALQWAMWRDQIDDGEFASTDGAEQSGDDEMQTEATGDAEGDPAGPEKLGDGEERTAVRRVLAEARSYVDAPPRWAACARRSPRETPGPCAPTVRAGHWSPGRTTSRSSSSTTSRARSCPWGAARSCPASLRPSTRWRYARAERRRHQETW